ncbi:MULTISPECIES: HK97 family phage prohead protease [Gordonia]|uniref:HK97 family phage prohead protease n=1 Tax=Gordonia amicalis TaxID=89053 RepID=A0AAE4R3X0_9ACTN|nr:MULTISPECIES: HK97 family phage prohead protease [Gordonia]ATD69188.1 major capsid protein [Gordonia sp. 1D]MCZ4654233.1 HK97 family phage prohead protease [Gordonia amicalis]MDJ0452112.1 HK97 family phage prohead protease [Gordonia amicalis]MDV6308183.1 HK97 family phage prohead protease [Gordonia amicalis]MDV6312006.1 HK97 family phage prohead protease [Gordonia amicalis]
MQRKTLTVAGIKTAGLDEGTFEGYASVFDNVDSAGDIVRRGAFTKALGADQVVPLLWEHQAHDPRAFVGEVVEARETAEGLAIKGRFDLDTEQGAAAYRQVKGRRVTGLSIGYYVTKARRTDAGNELLDLDLAEISVVSRPANDRALVGAVKSAAGTPTAAARSALARTRHRLVKSALTEGTPMPLTARLERLTKGRDEQLALADSIIAGAEELKRDLTADEAADVEAATEKAADLDTQIKAAKADDDVLRAASDLAGAVGTPGAGDGTTDASGRLALTGRAGKAAAARIVKAIPERTRGVKALTAGATTSTILDSTVYNEGRPPTSLLDVLTTRTVTPTYSFLRQTTRTLNAAPVATGATKPTSPLTVTPVDGKLEVIAHISEQIPHYVLSDNTNLEQFVADEMLFGLHRAVEYQVLNGDGEGANLEGILETSGVIVQAFATNILTSIRKAITTLEAGGYSPQVLAISAADWEALELLSVTSGATDVRGLPVDAVTRKLFGVQAVVSNVLPAKTAALISNGAVAVDTDGNIETVWSDAVADDFAKNYVRCRVEGRFGVSVFRPAGIVKISTAAA